MWRLMRLVEDQFTCHSVLGESPMYFYDKLLQKSHVQGGYQFKKEFKKLKPERNLMNRKYKYQDVGTNKSTFHMP